MIGSFIISSPSSLAANELNTYERVNGTDRYKTAIAISKQGWPNGLTNQDNSVILARSDNPADALASASLSGVKDAPILLTSTSNLPSSVQEEMKRLNAKKVYVLGGPNAISQSVINQLEKMGLTTTRVAGDDRFETAKAIHKASGLKNSTKAIVANGFTIADALSASSHSAIEETPIYLTRNNRLPSSLSSSVQDVTIYGGPGVISNELQNQMEQSGIDTTRLSGNDRFETNIDAAKHLSSTANKMLFVRGISTNSNTEDYPDAVAASGLANRLKAQVILVHPSKDMKATEHYISNKEISGFVLGGENALPERALTNMYLLKKNGSISQEAKQVLELTNKERTKRGLSKLDIDPYLTQVAQEKSTDMKRNKYFKHTSPTYGTPFEMIQSFGINTSASAENIGLGYPSPEDMVNGWMNSEGHRRNILNENYTHIGIGYLDPGHYWTQMFIQK